MRAYASDGAAAVRHSKGVLQNIRVPTRVAPVRWAPLSDAALLQQWLQQEGRIRRSACKRRARAKTVYVCEATPRRLTEVACPTSGVRCLEVASPCHARRKMHRCLRLKGLEDAGNLRWAPRLRGSRADQQSWLINLPLLAFSNCWEHKW